jgi:hypothetical protein
MKPANIVSRPTKEQVRMEMEEIRRARESGKPLGLEEIRRQLGWNVIDGMRKGMLR